MRFIGAHPERWGVEPICRTLQVAPSTYYAAVSRLPSARQLSDRRLKIEIVRVHRANFGVYGIEKVWRQLKREDIEVGRDRVARLMAELDLTGMRRKKKRTTVPAELSARPADLVERRFSGAAPSLVGGGPDLRQYVDRLRVRGLCDRRVLKVHRWLARLGLPPRRSGAGCSRVEHVELATAGWVDWWNHQRLHSARRDVPPADVEALYHCQRAGDAAA